MDPELMRVRISEFGIKSEVSHNVSEFRPERADCRNID